MPLDQFPCVESRDARDESPFLPGCKQRPILLEIIGGRAVERSSHSGVSKQTFLDALWSVVTRLNVWKWVMSIARAVITTLHLLVH